MNYIYFFLFIAIIYLTCKLSSLIFRTTRLVYRLSKLKKQGAIVKFNLQKHSKNDPDIIISHGEKIFLIRCFNGEGLLKTVHFVSSTLAVSYIPMRARISRRRSLGKGYKSSTMLSKLKDIKPIICDSEYLKDLGFKPTKESDGKSNIISVLLFTKAAGEVTALTENGTGIKCAYTGDNVFEYLIFTDDTLISFIEREKRKAEIDKDGYKYFSNC